MTKSTTLAAVAVACSVFAATGAFAGPRDTFTLGAVERPGWAEHFFLGIAMNDAGAVVASLSIPSPTDWYTGPDGHGVNFAPPGMDTVNVAFLTGIDDAGRITGSYFSPTGEHAFVTTADGSGFVDLHPAGALRSVATAIDQQGRVAGAWTNDSRVYFVVGPGFRNDSQGASYQQLGTGQQVNAKAIRNGVVVGSAATADGHFHAVRTSRTGAKLTDLGTFGGTDSTAYGANDAGVVVGSATDAAGVEHAFITQADGSLRRLDADGTFSSSRARAIDAKGHVVGSGILAGTNEQVAFVTQADGGRMIDLNSLTRVHKDSQLQEAVAINAKGQILVNDYYDDQGPWLLTPAATSSKALDAH